MGRLLLKLSFKSLKRRWREITRACVATFLAVFFITGVLLFQDNMYQWQMASNMERFGDWFVMDVINPEPSDYIRKHPYIEGYEQASYVMPVYAGTSGDSITYMGYMTEGFIEKSHIKAEIGRMPEAKGEIAMDYDTLSQFGYKAEAGQKIKLYYRDGTQRVCKEYRLVGILRNYTSSWPDGDQLPGVIVTQSEADSYDEAVRNLYIYSLDDSVRTDEYRLIFDNMEESYGSPLIYNENVYDYKPWGLPIVYNYMYILVMAIGITALTYQMIAYRTSRQGYNTKLRRMGATKGQINFITYMENMLIIVPFGLLGVAGAGIIGKAICMWIEAQMQVHFYRLNTQVFVKALISIVIAVIVEELVSVIYTIHNKKLVKVGVSKHKKKVVVSTSAPKVKLNKNNFDYVVHLRFMKSNGRYQNLAVRLFSLVICVVIVVCAVNVVTAYKANEANEATPDIIGYKQETDNYYYRYPMFIMSRYGGGAGSPDNWKHLVGKEYGNYEEDFNTYFFGDNFSQQERVSYGLLMIQHSKYMKDGNTNLTKGYSQSFVNNLKSVNGIDSVLCSYFETQRMWSWDGMDFEKMGIEKLSKEGEVSVAEYGDRYWYATNYVSATQKLYDKLGKYIDEQYLDYEAFANGEQVVLFIDDNPNGEYDDTISAGEKINYHYYDVPLYFTDNGNQDKVFAYNDGFEKLAIGKLYSREEAEDWRATVYAENSYDSEPWSDEELLKDWYQLNFSACVEPTVAGVVKLTAEIKEEFKDLFVDYGYYTAIASAKMAENACEKQNELMADLLNIDELPDDAKCAPIYNQVSIYYDLSSSYSATANIVKVYFKEANVKFISNTEEKETLRTKTISALLQYGITMLAAIVINVLIIAIVVQNRIASRREKLKTMVHMGADKSRLCRICMMEGVRESLWCVFTLPFVLLVEYVLYRKTIERLELQSTDYDILSPPAIVIWLKKKKYELSLISADRYAAAGVVGIMLFIVMIIPLISTKGVGDDKEKVNADYVVLETEAEREDSTKAERETKKVMEEPPPTWIKTYNEETKLWVISREKVEKEPGVTYVSSSTNMDQTLFSWGLWDVELSKAIVDNRGGTDENLSKYSYLVSISVYTAGYGHKAGLEEKEYKRLKAETDLNIHIGCYAQRTSYTLFGELTLSELRKFPAKDDYKYSIQIMTEGDDKVFDSVDVTGLVKYEEKEE